MILSNSVLLLYFQAVLTTRGSEAELTTITSGPKAQPPRQQHYYTRRYVMTAAKDVAQ
jgi:hypothetical protein